MISCSALLGTRYRLFLGGFLTIVGPIAGQASPFGQPYVIANESSQVITNAGSHPRDFTQIGNITYFSAASLPAGRELWRSDGTPNGTYLLKDINPAFVDNADTSLSGTSSTPGSFVNLNGTLMFLATTDVGRELWKSDGTSQGTTLVKDINPGRNSGALGNMTVFNNRIYYTGTIPQGHSSILIRSDGTAAGTDFFKDNTGAPLIDDVRGMVVSGNKLIVTTSGSLWVTDGTDLGSVEIPLPAGTRYPRHLIDVNGTAYFSLQEQSLDFEILQNARELWKTDGTAAGTMKVKEIRPGSNLGTFIDDLVSYKGKLYFSGAAPDDGPELWVSDGTDAGTFRFININPGAAATEYGSFPDALKVVGDNLWFGADASLAQTGLNESSVDPKRDPWISDGTVGGTRRVVDLDNTGAGFTDEVTDPQDFTLFNGLTYFIATHRPEPIVGHPFSGMPITTLFKSDGTPAGTQQVAEDYVFDGYIDQGSLAGSAVLFARPDMLLMNGGKGARLADTPFGTTANSELWKTNGSDAGTVLLKEIHAFPESANPIKGFALHNAFYLSKPVVDNGENLVQIFKTDGAPSNLSPVSTPGKVRNVQGATDEHLYYVSRPVAMGPPQYHLVAADADGGFENLLQVSNFFDLSYFTPWGDRALFSRQAQSDDLWVTDGSTSGTVKIFDQAGSNTFNEVAVVNSSVALIQNVPSFSQGPELWRTDGTTTGTYKLKDLTGGTADDISRIAVVGEKAVFFTSMNYGTAQREGGGKFRLVETDGTNAGTNTVINGALYTNSSTVPFSPMLGTAGGKLFFTYTPNTLDEAIGEELWVYDPAETTVSLTKDIWPGSTSSLPAAGNTACEYQGYLYFTANDGVHGTELWRTDGTGPGTIMVKDIDPGPRGSYPTALFKAGDALLFAANHPVAGYELYVLESANADPELLSDLNTGILPSTPRDFVSVNNLNLVFFTADSNTVGTELWALPAPLGPPPAAARSWELYE